MQQLDDIIQAIYINGQNGNSITFAKEQLLEWVNEVQQKNEIWSPISDYAGLYEVSNLGRVRSLARMTLGRHEKLKTSPGRVLKPQLTKNGYVRVELSKDNNRVKYFVHRLVAQAFIPNYLIKPCVNHIDNDRANNQVGNLEWCTYAENTDHGVTNGAITFPTYERTKGVCGETDCDREHYSKGLCKMHYKRMSRKRAGL